MLTLFLDTDDEGNVVHRPTLDEVDTAFELACDRIVLAGYGLPRVESRIFADDSRIDNSQLTLKTGDVEDESNAKTKKRLLHVLAENKVRYHTFGLVSLSFE